MEYKCCNVLGKNNQWPQVEAGVKRKDGGG